MDIVSRKLEMRQRWLQVLLALVMVGFFGSYGITFSQDVGGYMAIGIGIGVLLGVGVHCAGCLVYSSGFTFRYSILGYCSFIMFAVRVMYNYGVIESVEVVNVVFMCMCILIMLSLKIVANKNVQFGQETITIGYTVVDNEFSFKDSSLYEPTQDLETGEGIWKTEPPERNIWDKFESPGSMNEEWNSFYNANFVEDSNECDVCESQEPGDGDSMTGNSKYYP